MCGRPDLPARRHGRQQAQTPPQRTVMSWRQWSRVRLSSAWSMTATCGGCSKLLTTTTTKCGAFNANVVTLCWNVQQIDVSISLSDQEAWSHVDQMEQCAGEFLEMHHDLLEELAQCLLAHEAIDQPTTALLLGRPLGLEAPKKCLKCSASLSFHTDQHIREADGSILSMVGDNVCPPHAALIAKSTQIPSRKTTNMVSGAMIRVRIPLHNQNPPLTHPKNTPRRKMMTKARAMAATSGCASVTHVEVMQAEWSKDQGSWHICHSD